LLARCELDGALGLTTMAAEMLAGARTGRNGRLASYADVNGASRLRHDAAMHGRRGLIVWEREFLELNFMNSEYFTRVF
jgi:hypothetical protein